MTSQNEGVLQREEILQRVKALVGAYTELKKSSNETAGALRKALARIDELEDLSYSLQESIKAKDGQLRTATTRIATLDKDNAGLTQSLAAKDKELKDEVARRKKVEEDLERFTRDVGALYSVVSVVPSAPSQDLQTLIDEAGERLAAAEQSSPRGRRDIPRSRPHSRPRSFSDSQLGDADIPVGSDAKDPES